MQISQESGRACCVAQRRHDGYIGRFREALAPLSGELRQVQKADSFSMPSCSESEEEWGASRVAHTHQETTLK